MSSSMMDSLLAAQSMHERRYSCIVCMEAKMEMVYSICQHRVCSSCLYLDDGSLKPDMHKCPVCGKCLAFPQTRPHIPEDSIEMQKYLGVRECPNKDQGCKLQLWDWEMDEHISTCQFKKALASRRPRLSTSGLRQGKSVRESSRQQITCKTRSKKHMHNSNKPEHAASLRRSSRISRPEHAASLRRSSRISRP